MKAKTMTDLAAEHREELARLTQRIGQQNFEINRLHVQRGEDAALLEQARFQIVALNEELNTATGDEKTTNVVALMIEERMRKAARS